MQLMQPAILSQILEKILQIQPSFDCLCGLRMPQNKNYDNYEVKVRNCRLSLSVSCNLQAN
jgi:hypothetical protein